MKTAIEQIVDYGNKYFCDAHNFSNRDDKVTFSSTFGEDWDTVNVDIQKCLYDLGNYSKVSETTGQPVYLVFLNHLADQLIWVVKSQHEEAQVYLDKNASWFKWNEGHYVLESRITLRCSKPLKKYTAPESAS